MTWNEFKAAVDEKLAEAGADGNISIWYIDIIGLEDVKVSTNSGQMHSLDTAHHKELSVWST